ncbi:protein-disulfide isomerase [Roseiarcus fermentans]|uniref:Protein-disulfide isomerase n=1 Tax=Roseiarcus fermentans TaxID=1473586 RepID=A0A366F232_9HYPH|nr:DsbA family protein [Roseiarcus fermentans]RBP08664.1 protein-disulfide isomerase [Roseiarcus fermentans]
MDRRRFLLAFPAGAASVLIGEAAAPQAGRAAAANTVDIHAILDDPDAPVGGDPTGDVTIVAFIDYNCPFCKRAEPDLQRLVASDGKIRLVYKDWPILARSSVTGARLALAANYQGKYEPAHAALMALHGRSSDAAMRAAVASAGVDIARLDKDLDAHGDAIMDCLRRNGTQANALHLQGTPVYLVGPYLVAASLNYDQFSDVVAKFRAQIGK